MCFDSTLLMLCKTEYTSDVGIQYSEICHCACHEGTQGSAGINPLYLKFSNKWR